MDQYSELELNSTSNFALTGRNLGSEHGCQDYSGMLALKGARIVNEEWLLKVVEQRDLAAAQVDWLQKVNTLHRQVDILYVVDGYQVTVAWDGEPISEDFHGETVAEAIDKAMAGFDLGQDARHPFQVRELDPHERQMAALAAQRDELLAALESFVQHYDRHQEQLSEDEKVENDLDWFSAVDIGRAAIAKAKGGAA